VLEEIIDGRVSLVFPDLVRIELNQVLAEKLSFSSARAAAACDLLAQLATERPGTPQRIDAITGASADDAILATAAEAGVDLLATGDRKHLLPIGEHRGVKLLTPQALLALLLNEE
jgi:predicted nucleic acid-binding protein